MSEEPLPKPPFTYVVATVDEKTHWVMVVHDATIDWYRRVATFTSRQRADDYADLENTMARDSFGETGWRDQYNAEDGTPAPAAVQAVDQQSGLPAAMDFLRQQFRNEASPAAARSVALRVTSHVWQVRFPQNAPRPSEPVAETPEPVSKPCQGGVASGNPPSTPEVMAAPKPVEDGERTRDEGHTSEGDGGRVLPVPDGAQPSDQSGQLTEVPLTPTSKLQALSEKQAKVFAVMSANGKPMTVKEVADAAKYTNVHDALTGLKNKRYVTRIGTGYPERWMVIAAGPVALAEPVRVWTDAELDGLKLVCMDGGDIAAYAAKIVRTTQAVEAMARARRWYDHWVQTRAKVPAVNAEQPAVVAPVASPTDDDDDEPTNLDDLNLRQRRVLKDLCATPFDTIPRVAIRAKVEQTSMAYILNRLRDLGLIGSSNTPTFKGRALAVLIVDAPPPPAKPETKVSFPVVNRVDKTIPPPAKANGSANATFNVTDYLGRKGHSVTVRGQGQWMVDGRLMDAKQVLEVVNQHRRKAELPALTHL